MDFSIIYFQIKIDKAFHDELGRRYRLCIDSISIARTLPASSSFQCLRHKAEKKLNAFAITKCKKSIFMRKFFRSTSPESSEINTKREKQISIIAPTTNRSIDLCIHHLFLIRSTLFVFRLDFFSSMAKFVLALKSFGNPSESTDGRKHFSGWKFPIIKLN